MCGACQGSYHCPTRGGGGGGGGRRNYSTAHISKTAYRMHLGPSPFDSAPRTLRDHFWVNFGTFAAAVLPLFKTIVMRDFVRTCHSSSRLYKST